MINLLPPELKSTYRHARLNTHLRHWLVGAFVGLIGVVGLAWFGYEFVSHTAHNYQTLVSQKQTQLGQAHVNTTNADIKDLSGNVSLMLSVLNRQVLWPDLLKQLGTITPSGVTLTDFSISQDDTAINISATSSNYQTGTQLFTNLSDPSNKLFSRADLLSITCSDTTSCTVEIRALLTQDSPFLFKNSTGVTP